MVIRDGRAVFRTPQQEHDFGFPFQLSSLGQDSPEDAQGSRVQLKRGDMIIVASDGLFDNVEDEVIATELWKYRHGPCGLLAEYITDMAVLNSTSPEMETPYSKAATEEYSLIYRGGKMDDITAVVAKVGSTSR
eukprot:GFYU01008269.1.p1 GENE.GFYU01008269.1~~GFYU01008269.1.p1  ORF type:complete len:134 (-),score=17.58 GFYU01008269.1:37-438(-)